MSGMIERAIYNILAAGRAEATENSSFLVDFFCSIGLSVAEAEAIQEFWDEREIPNPADAATPLKGVDIIHAYPRGPNVVFPCWAIVLLSEAEGSDRGDRYLGDEVDDVYDSEDQFVGQALGSIWRSQHAVYVYAQTADLCIYYYELVRFFMTRSRPLFKSLTGGLVLDSAYSGADMMPDPRYAPEHMFVRRFMVESRKLQDVYSIEQPQRGTSIRGAHVGPTASEGQVSDVVANVGTYEEEDG